MIPPNELDRDVAAAVKKLKRQEILGPPRKRGGREVIGHAVEIEMHDKIAALRLLGQHYGLFVEQVRALDRTEFAALLRDARARAVGR